MKEDREMRRVIVILMLAVLVSQPFIAFGGGLAFPRTSLEHAALAQDEERGCRYSGTELTDHVPILIDNTTDFASQGWPGSGTQGSPYVISRLNITYDVGLVGIRVVNTTAYFVIRDCFVKQVSSVVCIELYNTSHASIEYTTAISPYLAIHCDYTNTLQISRCVGTGGTNMALTIDYANDTVLQWNLLSSTTRRGLLAEYCNDLHSSHNEYLAPNADYTCAYLVQCDRFTSQYDYSYQGNGGLYVYGSENATILGFEGEDNQIGIGADTSPRTTISDCIITNAAEYGVFLIESPNSTVGQCIVDGMSTNHGIHVENSGDTQVTDNQVLTCGSRGIFAENSDRVTLNNNQVHETPSDGMYILSSDGAILDHNQIHEAGEDGLYIQDCENVTVTANEIMESAGRAICVITGNRADMQGNVVNHAGEEGIYSSSSDYINVYGNTISDIGEGICIDDGIEANVEQNTIGMCATGIVLLSHDNATVTDNTVEDTATGVYFEHVWGIALRQNTIAECTEDGVWFEYADFCIVEDNTIEDCKESGIWVRFTYDTTIKGNTIISPAVRGNIFSGPTVRGILVTGCLNLTFDDNHMSECGFLLTASLPIEYYNHTFTDNLVNGLPVYYGWNISEVAITGSGLGQVLLFACENVTLSGGVFDRSTVAVHGFYCEEIHLVGVASDENYVAIFLRNTFNSTVSGATITESTYGVRAEYCELITVDNTHVSHQYVQGAHLYLSTNTTIRDSIFEYSHEGVYAEVSDHGTIADCEFRHITQAGVILNADCNYWNLTRCEFFNMTNNGLYIQSQGGTPLYTFVLDSQFTHCGDAIEGYGSTAGEVSVFRSEFYSNGDSITVAYGYNWHIINSTILWSSGYGVYLYQVDNPEIYGNTIALSGTANGWSNNDYDWDDGISLGNSWDNYVPPPPYHIGSGGVGENVLVSGVPVTSSLSAVGDTEMWTIAVPVSATSMYTVLDGPAGADFDVYGRLGAAPTTSTYDWRGYAPGDDAVTFSSPGAGTWYVMVRAYSGTGSYTLTVTITYQDGGIGGAVDNFPSLFLPTEPIIDSHLDLSYAEGTTGHYIIWHPYDDYLRDWTVTIDGLAWAGEAWNFDSINVTIDGLSYGTHTVTVTVWDVYLNTATDEVTIHVFDETPPMISQVANTEAFVGATGQSLTWEASDLHPSSYVVFRDGEQIETGDWEGGPVSTSLDGLPLGEYVITMMVYDLDGNSAQDTVRVLVLTDDTTPTIDSPQDIVFVVDTIGNQITWTANDDHPRSYEVIENGTVVASRTWTGGRVSLSLDSLPVGTYDFTITVRDGAGHNASDTVTVRVIPYEGYVEPGVFDLGMLLMVGGVAGAAVVVVGAAYHIRKRRTTH